MRLIDADALIDELGISDEDIIVEGMLEDAQTIDAVPVVRCKDCMRYEPLNDCKPFDCEYSGMYGVTKDDFCSYGERKDDDKSCDTCKHHDKGWDDIVCDGCTKAHSNWERKDDE